MTQPAQNSLLHSLALLMRVPAEDVFLLIIHACRFDPHLLRLCEDCSPSCAWTWSIALVERLRSFLPQYLSCMHVAAGICIFPFQSPPPVVPCPVLCFRPDGQWECGHCVPAPHHFIQQPSLPAQGARASADGSSLLIAFVVALAALVPCSPEFVLTAAAHEFSHERLLQQGFNQSMMSRVVCALHALFPKGLLQRDCNRRWWVLGGRAAVRCKASVLKTPYLFVQRAANGVTTPWLHTAATFPQSWPQMLRIGAALVFLPCGDVDISPSSFFSAIGISRCDVVQHALHALARKPDSLRDLLTPRMQQLFSFDVAPAGWDLHHVVELLPHFFPSGLLLIHGEGFLLHFQAGRPPCSVLPEDLWQFGRPVVLHFVSGNFVPASVQLGDSGDCIGDRVPSMNCFSRWYRFLHLPLDLTRILVGDLTSAALFASTST